MDSPLIGVLFLVVFPALLSASLTQRMSLEDFKNPGGWKFPKAEVVGLGAVLGGLIFGLVCLLAIAG